MSVSMSTGLRLRLGSQAIRAPIASRRRDFSCSKGCRSSSAEKPTATTSSSSASTSTSSGKTASSPTQSDQSKAEKQERDNVLAQIRKALRQKRTEIEPALKKKLEDLGKRWNQYSGYEEVEEAKAQTLEAEIHLKTLRDQQTSVRSNYMNAVSSRSTSQKTLNDLLNRRASWSDEDISTYTQMLRDEHSQARIEREAGEKYESIERKVNEAWDDVVKKSLERYHLEQLWSDKVRAGSTYGGLIVAGLNGECYIT